MCAGLLGSFSSRESCMRWTSTAVGLCLFTGAGRTLDPAASGAGDGDADAEAIVIRFFLLFSLSVAGVEAKDQGRVGGIVGLELSKVQLHPNP